jgi:hypothetical protein
MKLSVESKIATWAVVVKKIALYLPDRHTLADQCDT